jgi:superfamily II DNA or RNA helicase
MTTQLADFIPSYPLYERNELPLFNVYDDEQKEYYPDMYQTLRRKKEFSELTLPANEEQPVPGQLLMHQLFIQRFLSGYTPYHSLLIWHEVGTGKTLTSLSVAENMKQFQATRALILVKGRNVERNIRYEIRKHFPYYVPIYKDKTASLRQINERINASYEINTFRIFCKEIAFAFSKSVPEDQRRVHQERIKAQYSNRVIIIDEVHNLREKGSENVYNFIHQFLHTVENCKILLLSATPIKDSVEEFASIMNLILPLDKQFNVATFEEVYFPNKKEMDATKKAEFISRIKGYISYLRQSKNQAKVIEIGTIIPSAKGFPIVPLIMKDEQTMQYQSAIDNDGGLPEDKTVEDYMSQEKTERRTVIEEESVVPQRTVIEEDAKTDGTGIYQESRQAILSCFPADPAHNRPFTYGSGVKQKLERTERTEHYEPHVYEQIAKAMVGRGTLQTKLESLEKYSNKFHYVTKSLLDYTGRKMFVYSEFIGGSGLFLLEQVLVQFQFQHCDKRKQATLNDNPYEHILQSEPRPRYAIITSKLSDVDIYFLLHIFNHPLNKYGQYIRVLMGSKTIGESHSLTCIRDIMILTPHWNYTETEQAIGRGVRAFSHRDLPVDQQTVTIHRLVSLLPEQKRTVDQYMYEVSYHKDLMIKQIEYASRESAIDCTFHKNRNRYDNDLYRDKRECFYKDCDYLCYEEDKDESVTLEDTYNLFYTEKEYRQVKEILQYQFKTVSRFSYAIDEMIQLIHDQNVTFPTHVTLRCLNEIIYRQERFVNPLGFTSYLKEHQNEFFLSFHILRSQEEDVFYTQQGELYPRIDPFVYINQLESDSINLIITSLRQSTMGTATRILSQLPKEVRFTILKGVIELYYDEPSSRASRPYLQLLMDSGISKDWLLAYDTIESMPPEKYIKVEGVYTWVKDIYSWTSENIKELIDILQSNSLITAYGYKKEGKLYLYDLAQKKFLTELKRSGRDCDTLPIEVDKKGGSSLHDYYKRLIGQSDVAIPKERSELCRIIKSQLASFTIDDKPFSLLFSGSVHDTMRAYLSEKQQTKKQKVPEDPTEEKSVSSNARSVTEKSVSSNARSVTEKSVSRKRK